MKKKLLTAAEVSAWSDPSQETIMSHDEAVLTFQTLGPRVRFLKTLPVGSVVLDAGAGDGSLVIFKDWPAPARPDLRMFAWAGEKGANFERFEGWEVGYWPQDPPKFPGIEFDAIMSSNFLEHIDEWPKFIEMAASRLKPGGSFYLEWPRVESIDLPSVADLTAANVDVVTGKYHDDVTHREAPPLLEDVLKVLSACNIEVVQRGVVEVPMIDQQLAIYARKTNDVVGMTLAYWSMSGWCQYLMAVRT
jgi:SAM-dependent methyltransferase